MANVSRRGLGRPKEIDGELETIAVTITSDLADRVRKQAVSEERSNSAIVRRILAEYFARLDEEAKAEAEASAIASAIQR